MEKRKALVLSTLAAALAVFGVASVRTVWNRSVPKAASTVGFTSIGSAEARIEIVVIEDFLCRNCRAFSLEILPKIQSEYIKKGLARLTLVPVSFMAGSKEMANAGMEVYKNYPDQFFPFLEAMIMQAQNGEVRANDILRIARRVGAIDLNKLQLCMEKNVYGKELEQNLEWAKDYMGHNFRTPALFINGLPGSTFSFLAVKDQINQMLGR